AMSNAKTSSGAFKSPVDVIVNPLTEKIIVVDKSGIYKIATGEKLCVPGKSFIKKGAFKGTSMSDGSVGAIVVCMGFVILVCALLSLVHMLAKVFMGPTKKLVGRLLNYNGYVNIFVGTLITFSVHSSTVVTSTLTPLAGLGVVTLEQSDSVAIALVHFWFNVFGIFLFYPIPITRKPILGWARSLAFFSASWPFSAALFLLVLFIVAPGILLGLVYMCTADATVTQVFGWIIAVLVLLVGAGVAFWYSKKGGREVWYAFLERKRNDREARINGGEKKSVVGEDQV
ncbi:hypothetical protein PybrP1_010676, partial [[Pythium] brassicae (nom. inval.)]